MGLILGTCIAVVALGFYFLLHPREFLTMRWRLVGAGNGAISEDNAKEGLAPSLVAASPAPSLSAPVVEATPKALLTLADVVTKLGSTGCDETQDPLLDCHLFRFRFYRDAKVVRRWINIGEFSVEMRPLTDDVITEEETRLSKGRMPGIGAALDRRANGGMRFEWRLLWKPRGSEPSLGQGGQVLS